MMGFVDWVHHMRPSGRGLRWPIVLLAAVVGVVHGQDMPAMSSSSPAPAASAPTPATPPLWLGSDFQILAHPMPTPAGIHQVILFVRACTPTSDAAAAALVVMRQQHPQIKWTLYPGVVADRDDIAARVALAVWRLGAGDDALWRLSADCQAGLLNGGAPALRHWVANQGWPVPALQTTINGDWVIEHAAALPSLTRAYGISSLPAAVIDGRYRIPWTSGMTGPRFASIILRILAHAPIPASSPPFNAPP